MDGNDDYNYNYGEGHGKYADDYSYRDESDYDRYYSEYDYNYQDGNEVDTYEVMDVESDDLGNSVVEMPYADDLDPFAWMPSDLLQPADKDLLRTLNALFEEPGSTRATLLNEYFEDLGLDAAEFVARFEEAFGNRALHLHDDLPGVAAVLATYRMVEQGELGMDAGVEALQRQFNGLSPEWIEDVSFIVTELPDDRGVRAEHAPRNVRGRVLQAILAVSTRSIQDAGLGLSAFFGDLTTLPGRVLTIGDAVRLTQFGTAALRNWTAR
ncbi:MAG: hypothetical protein U1E05_21265 [Patescibacteria group bacterium]|nr:hypothetical protein [Patescibacteria group bacterium]